MSKKCKDGSDENGRTTAEGAAEVLARIAKRALYDPDYCEELKNNQADLLRAAGMSIVAIARLQGRTDLSESELQGYLSALDDANGDGPSELKLTNFCVATCKKQTFWICGGCTHTVAFKALG